MIELTVAQALIYFLIAIILMSVTYDVGKFIGGKDAKTIHPPLKPSFQFAEWIGTYYNRCAGCWVHKHSNQMDKKNHKTTSQLYIHWIHNKPKYQKE